MRCGVPSARDLRHLHLGPRGRRDHRAHPTEVALLHAVAIVVFREERSQALRAAAFS